jgi:hypothetical protein
MFSLHPAISYPVPQAIGSRRYDFPAHRSRITDYNTCLAAENPWYGACWGRRAVEMRERSRGRKVETGRTRARRERSIEYQGQASWPSWVSDPSESVTLSQRTTRNERASARRVAVGRSAQKVATSQIVNCKHDALEIVPPDDRRDIRIGLPHRCCDLPQHGKAVICLQ